MVVFGLEILKILLQMNGILFVISDAKSKFYFNLILNEHFWTNT